MRRASERWPRTLKCSTSLPHLGSARKDKADTDLSFLRLALLASRWRVLSCSASSRSQLQSNRSTIASASPTRTYTHKLLPCSWTTSIDRSIEQATTLSRALFASRERLPSDHPSTSLLSYLEAVSSRNTLMELREQRRAAHNNNVRQTNNRLMCMGIRVHPSIHPSMHPSFPLFGISLSLCDRKSWSRTEREREHAQEVGLETLRTTSFVNLARPTQWTVKSIDRSIDGHASGQQHWTRGGSRGGGGGGGGRMDGRTDDSRRFARSCSLVLAVHSVHTTRE